MLGGQPTSFACSARQVRKAFQKLAVAFSSLKPIYSEALNPEDPSQIAWGGALLELEAVATRLNLQKADRSYRASFTENYQTLFPSDERHYRMDVLMASIERQEYIWLNGIRYDLSADIMGMAAKLNEEVRLLYDFITCPSAAAEERSVESLPQLLSDFDTAWANFEQNYIKELEAIEAASRAVLLETAAAEQVLRELESCSSDASALRLPQRNLRDAQLDQDVFSSTSTSWSVPSNCIGSPTARSTRLVTPASPPSAEHRAACRGEPSLGSSCSRPDCSGASAYDSASLRQLAISADPRLGRCSASRRRYAALQRLTEQIAKLNACANAHGKGRADLGIEVLESAAVALSETAGEGEKPVVAARRALATRVLTAFSALRSYLSGVREKMKYIDPQLANNGLLAQRLKDWEEAWEVGNKYLLDAKLLTSITALAATVAAAHSFSPKLREVCEDQDSELFMILPRLVWLCALVEPRRYAALPSSLLPQHFAASPELGPAALRRKYEQAVQGLQRIGRFKGASSNSCSGPIWVLLVSRAVSSCRSGREELDSALEDFMRQLEAESIQLQRHVPEDWNRCCSVLLECVAAAASAK